MVVDFASQGIHIFSTAVSTIKERTARFFFPHPWAFFPGTARLLANTNILYVG